MVQNLILTGQRSAIGFNRKNLKLIDIIKHLRFSIEGEMLLLKGETREPEFRCFENIKISKCEAHVMMISTIQEIHSQVYPQPILQ